MPRYSTWSPAHRNRRNSGGSAAISSRTESPSLVVRMGEGSPEHVAYKLTWDVASVENGLKSCKAMLDAMRSACRRSWNAEMGPSLNACPAKLFRGSKHETKTLDATTIF